MTTPLRSASLFLATVAFGAAFTACNPFSKPLSESELNQGYGLFYDLIKSESQVKELLIIKSPAEPIAELVREISTTAGSILETMDEWKKVDPQLNYSQTGLPEAEQETRASIASYRAKQLVLHGGEPFEHNLIFTQSEAATYAWHLAKVLAESEENTERKAAFEGWAEVWQAYAERADNLLAIRLSGERRYETTTEQTDSPTPMHHRHH